MKSMNLKLVLSWVALVVLSFQAVAQQPPALPIDGKVRYGKLSNGLTYYIRHNDQQKQRAEFYIAQNVGSILEEDSQSGLAHFLEHMAFNGTKNFPGKTMLSYLESIGVKFGENVNAYTSFDQTVYNLSQVPVTRETIVDSCLLVLHDWSGFITLDNKEIDQERGVIREEWRTRSNANMRMLNQLLPEVYVGSQYANRLPIGSMDVVMNFKYQTLKDYYKKWYRPDLQALVVVGDIDVDQVEAKIKKMFADIPAPVNAAARTYYQVPDNDQPIVSIASDPEATSTSISIYFKHDGLPKELKPTQVSLVYNYLTNLATSMLNNRIQEITQKPTSPFLQAGFDNEDFIVSKTKEAFSGSAVCKAGEISKGFKALLEELYRVDKFGFTETELARAKANLLRSYESAYNDREKQINDNYVQEYVNHFTDGEVIPGIEFEYDFANKVVPQLPLEQVNKLIQQYISEKNIVLLVMGPKKEGLVYPSKDEILSIFNSAKSAELTPYLDKVSNEPLVPKAPKAGKVTKVTTDKTFDATIWTLSNGARVIIKKTDFKKDQILFKATSFGGTSLIDNKDIVNILTLNQVISVNGLGSFSNTDLPKVLAGKKVKINPAIGTTTESQSGSCSPKDLETLLQLNYLSFTAPRFDKDAYDALMKRTKVALENGEVNPMTALRDSLNKALYGNHPRAQRLKADMLDKVSYERIQQIYKERYANAGDFTFFFVGNVEIDSLKPLVEKYIASLPSKGKKEKYADTKQLIFPGKKSVVFNKEMETAKATVVTIFSGDCKFSLENTLKMSMLEQVMDIVFTDKVREEQGGTYGVGVQGSVSDYPKDKFRFLVSFDTNEAQKEQLLAIVHQQLDSIALKGPSEVNFNKVKEFMLKKQKESAVENGFWLGNLSDYFMDGQNNYSTYESTLNAITPEQIRAFAASLFKQGNNIELIMNGVKK